MKNRIVSILTAATVATSLISGIAPVTAMADGTMVTSIGADLTQDQVTAILKYFGIYGNNNVQRITVTNQDERRHLASSIPIEQIGTRTISCSLVKPTTSGGVKVKTANLDYVTSNMIASNLVTCGVTNCEAIAAAPFVVSGTGALTGILMAYQDATGTQISQQALDLSAQEISLTQQISNTAENQQVAQQIVNDVKLQVIDGTVDNSENTDNSVIVDNSVDNSQVNNIVNNVVNNYTTNNNGIQLTEEDMQALSDYAVKLAQQSYEAGAESAQQQVQALAPIQQELSDQNGVQSSDTTTTIVNNNTTVNVNTDNTNNADGGSANASAEGGDSTSSDSILNKTDVNELASLNGGDTSSVPVTGTDAAATQTDLANGATNQDEVIAENTTGQSETGETTAQTDAAAAETTAQTDASGLQIQITDSNSQDATAPQTDAPAADTTAQTDASGLQIEATDSNGQDTAAEQNDAAAADTSAQTDADGNAVLTPETQAAEEAAAAAAPAITADQMDSYSTSYLTQDGMATVPAFTLALKSDNLVPVSGTLTVSDGSGNVLGTADLADKASVTAVTSGAANDEFKNMNGWDQLTGLFFQPKDGNGSVITPQAGMTYTLTLNGTFAQTADLTQVQTAPIVAVDLENISYTAPVNEGAGFDLSATSLSDITAGGTLTTALFDDGTFATANLSNPDGTASVQAADGSETVNAGGDMTVYITLQNAPGLVEVDIAYAQAEETEFDENGNAVAAAGGEGTTLRYFIPVQQA